MRDILVIRFGSLGDLCLLGWSLAALADHADEARPRITLVTKSAFAPLMAQMRGVDQVESPASGSLRDLARLAGRLRQRRWHRVLDAHHILRGHILLAMLGRRPQGRIRKDTPARLRLLSAARRGQRPDPEASAAWPTMGQRFDAVLGAALDPPQALPAATAPPLAAVANAAEVPAPLGMAPGAQWETKRWPEAAFTQVLRSVLDTSDVPVRVFLGPREETWYAGGELERVAATSARVQVVRDATLADIAARLAPCRALLTNDSGLLHLAEAVGVPVLALYGPTVREFGYFPRLSASQVLETPLDCRPCSRNGKRPCHRGDLACLNEISPASVLAALAKMGGLT